MTAVGARSASAKARAGLTTNEVFSLAATLLRQGRLRLMPTRHWVRSLGRGRGRRWRANRTIARAALLAMGQRQIAAHVVAPWIRPATHLLTIREGFTLACYLGLPAASSLYRVEWAYRRGSIKGVVRLGPEPAGVLAVARRSLEHWLKDWKNPRKAVIDLARTQPDTPISARDAWRLGRQLLAQGVILRAPSLELIYKALRHSRIPDMDSVTHGTLGPRRVYERWLRRWGTASPRTNLDSLSGDVLTLTQATALANATRPARGRRPAPSRAAIQRAAENGEILLAQPRAGRTHFRLNRANFEQWLRNYHARSVSNPSAHRR